MAHIRQELDGLIIDGDKIYHVPKVNIDKMLEDGMKRMGVNREKDMNTRYKLLKPISGKIICEEACKEEFDKFVKHFGFHTKIAWDKENEDWISENIHLGIKFLEDHEYIDLIKPKLKFNQEKTYCFEGYKGDIYKLSMGHDSRFSWINISKTQTRWESVNHETPLEAIESITKHYCVEIIEFDNIQEAINHFTPIKGDEILDQMTEQEMVNLFYDIKEKLGIVGFRNGCPIKKGIICPLQVPRCSDCKFNMGAK